MTEPRPRGLRRLLVLCAAYFIVYFINSIAIVLLVVAREAAPCDDDFDDDDSCANRAAATAARRLVVCGLVTAVPQTLATAAMGSVIDVAGPRVVLALTSFTLALNSAMFAAFARGGAPFPRPFATLLVADPPLVVLVGRDHARGQGGHVQPLQRVLRQW